MAVIDGTNTLALGLDPAIGLVAIIASSVLFTGLALVRAPLRPIASHEEGPARTDPLEGFFKRRNAATARGTNAIFCEGALLHARICGPQDAEGSQGAQNRKDMLETVAGIMRAGLRRTDSVHLVEGDGFVILAPGAGEREAAGIAHRLRRAMSGLRMQGQYGDMRVKTSFGVAERRSGESLETASRRADHALEIAVRAGDDCVIAASEIEEILLLPAPAPPASKAVRRASTRAA